MTWNIAVVVAVFLALTLARVVDYVRVTRHEARPEMEWAGGLYRQHLPMLGAELSEEERERRRLMWYSVEVGLPWLDYTGGEVWPWERTAEELLRLEERDRLTVRVKRGQRDLRDFLDGKTTGRDLSSIVQEVQGAERKIAELDAVMGVPPQ